MVAFEISSFSLEARVARDYYSRYKRVWDIITKADIPALGTMFPRVAQPTLLG